MNEYEFDKCIRLLKFLRGVDCTDEELSMARGSAKTFAEFRIKIFTTLALVPATTHVADKWIAATLASEQSPDLNVLMHALESVAEAQNKLEVELRDGNRALADKLADLDKLATMQYEAQVRLAEMRAVIAKYRHSIVSQAKSQDTQGAKIA